MCRRCGAATTATGIELEYLGCAYEISFPEVSFHPETISLAERILLLHYLTGMENQPTKDKYVSYKDLPNAMFYYAAFRNNGPASILRQFGSDPDRIVAAAESLGGSKTTFGDVSVELSILPNISMAFVLHAGDSEFPPEAHILFKDNIINYLPLEDISILAGIAARKLVQATKASRPGR